MWLNRSKVKHYLATFPKLFILQQLGLGFSICRQGAKRAEMITKSGNVFGSSGICYYHKIGQNTAHLGNSYQLQHGVYLQANIGHAACVVDMDLTGEAEDSLGPRVEGDADDDEDDQDEDHHADHGARSEGL